MKNIQPLCLQCTGKNGIRYVGNRKSYSNHGINLLQFVANVLEKCFSSTQLCKNGKYANKATWLNHILLPNYLNVYEQV